MMHDHMTHDQAAGLETDPVCGMSVDPAKARPAGLVTEHAGRTFFFCGKGCLLEFRDDPDHYLDPGYVPSM